MQLWPHQQEAREFAAPFDGCMLAMEMGTGKTPIGLTWIQDKGAHRTLVVAPSNVVTNGVWEDEAAVWYPKATVHTLTGTGTKRIAELATARLLTGPTIWVINYEALSNRKLQAQLRLVDWDALILDESHRIKSPGGKWSLFLASLCWSKSALEPARIPYRLCLTGTPMPHSPLDIYAQARVFDPSLYGRNNRMFKLRYADWGGYENRVATFPAEKKAALLAKLDTRAYRVLADKVLDLPEELDIDIKCDLTPRGRRAYNDMYETLVADVDEGVVTAGNALSRLLRLQQLAGGHAAVEDGVGGSTLVRVDDAKVKVFKELMSDLDEPVVIFAKFKAELDDIGEVMDELEFATYMLRGGDNQYRQWRDESTHKKALVVQIQAGGEGIDMSQARVGVYYSTGFDMGMYLQSRGRIHPRRVGKSDPTVFYHILARATVDIDVRRGLKNRENLVLSILKHLKGQ